MFDGLLKSKFQTKCKSSIKLTRARLEMIKRKRNAMQKYLKNDIADLLKNGLDFNAYGRAEGFLVELNLSSCYEFVEQSCGCISDHLSVMSKQRECPEECRDAVSTLMFAAARFADLPELRELRSLFAERYGNSVESYVNKEFAAKLKSAPPSKDMKFQLMHDIAHEFGIEWDSKALEQRLYKPPAPQQDGSKNTTYYKQNNLRDTAGGKKQDVTSTVIEKVIYDGHKSWQSPSNYTQNGQNSCDSVTSSSEEEVNDDKRHFSYSSIPPPYTRPNVSKTNSSSDVLPIGSDAEGVGPRKLNDDLDEETKYKEKPRSVRSRPLKSPPGHNNIGGAKGDEKLRKKKLEIDCQDKSDEEERMMDQLLIHYSKKQPPYEAEAKQQRGQEYSLGTRAASFPVETTSPIEKTTGPARATSLQPDMSNSGHGQPKLLDYDDFVARLAALRGEGKYR